MKIKKFEATTEQAAIEMVRDELGADALVLSIKTTKPRGLWRFFRKPVVEVTAALDEARREAPNPNAEDGQRAAQQETVRRFEQLAKEAAKDAQLAERDAKIEDLESLLVSRDELLANMQRKLSVAGYAYPPVRRFANNYVQTFYNQLTEQGVKAEIAAGILQEFDSLGEEQNPDVALIVNVVYDRLVEIIGRGEPIQAAKGRGDAAVNVFIGPTGVGKTTTIAKLSADFILNQNLRAGLITADTYRIAAVEQLKVYADILGIDVGVVYNRQDLLDYVELMKLPEDIILIDTAGRSHRNRENIAELKDLLDNLTEYSAYLVLSLTTKYEDMLDIVNTYAEQFDFKLIFTKLDETLSLGAALNLCYETRRKVSYVTFGQNVPEDIAPLRAEDIARSLLGGGLIGGGRE